MSIEYFAIIGAMRSGSNLLERSLDHHDDLVCFGELFNPDFVGSPEPEKAIDFSLKKREQDPHSLLDWMRDNADGHVPGFRIFPNHNETILEHVIKDDACAKIILTRNLIDSFVSLKLAQKTDQWRMGDVDTKIDAKIDFDWSEFETYLAEHRRFHKSVRRGLQKSGTSALLVDYEDLQNLDTLNGIAKFVGSQKTSGKLKFRSSKQNAYALSEKVANYYQVTDEFKQNARIDFAQWDYFEPAITIQSRAVVLGKNIDLAYLPTRILDGDPISDWIKKLDPEGAAPQSGLGKAQLHTWFKSNQIKFVFTDLEHPVERAYRNFCEFFMFSGAKYAGIRSLLEKRYDADLLPQDYSGRKDAKGLTDYRYTAKSQRSNFKAFLKFLKSCLQDQALYQPKPEFSTQSAWLDAHQEWGVPHFIALPHNRVAVFEAIANSLGQEAPVLASTPSYYNAFPLEEIYDLQIEKLTRAAYQRDYRRFGFLDYLISPK